MKRARREAVARKRVCSLKAEPCDGDEPVLVFALDSDSDAFESGAVEEVTESARACSYILRNQVQKISQFWLLTFWLLTFWLLTVPSTLRL